MADNNGQMAGSQGQSAARYSGARWWLPIVRLLDGDDPATRLSKIRAFEIIFVSILGAEYWARAIPKWGALSPLYLATLPLASVLCLAALTWPLRRAAFAGLALAHAVIISQEFPAAGNHAYLELIFCSLCAFLDPRRLAEQVLLLRSVRWLVCVIFFWGGVQKAVHGYYARGQFLAYSLGATPWFGTAFELFVPREEFARLAAYKGQVGDGPYLVDSTAFTVFSHAVYLFEIALVPLLLARRTRVAGVLAAIAFLTAIEIGARELFFGLVFVNAVLLFLPSDFNRRLIPAFAAFLAILLLIRVGVLPEMVFY